MAKLFSAPAEAIGIRALCSRDKSIAGYVLSHTDESFFHVDESREAFNLIRQHIEKKGEAPPFKLLCEELGLSEEARAHLRQASGQPKTIPEATELTDALLKYRQTRIYYSLAKSIVAKLEGNKVDTDSLAELVANKLTQAQLKKSNEDNIYHIGKNNNTDALVDEIIHGEDTDDIIPTGWETYDSKNGGFPRGALVAIGGSSGAGKSHTVGQLALNQALMGYKVVVVPLEMTEHEYMIRFLANVCRIDSLRILKKQLTTEEKAFVDKRWAQVKRKIAKAGGRLTVYAPKEDQTLEEIFAVMHSYNADVYYVDYIGLLKGADGEDQWRKLGQISRYGKVYAGNHGKVVVLACQVGEDGRIRYSQAIKEHAAVAMIFVATKESREKGYLNISMLKARMGMMFDFILRIFYEHSRVIDLDPSEVEKNSNLPSEPGSKDKGSGDEKNYMPDLTE